MSKKNILTFVVLLGKKKLLIIDIIILCNPGQEIKLYPWGMTR